MAFAQNDQVVLAVGPGINASTSARMVSLGMQGDFWHAFKDRFTIGGWIDNSGLGRASSMFMTGQMGFEVNGYGTVAGFFTGPGLISTPDSYLGGMFQFVSDIHLGVQDRNEDYFGFFYRHISSAGIYYINVGRDVIGIEMRL